MNGRDRRRKLWEIRETADALRNAPIQTPDLTQAILDRVDVERPFLAPSVRRRLPWIHVSIGLAVVTTVLGVALMHRAAPNRIALVPQPAPLARVVECVECAAAERVGSFTQSLAQVTPPEPIRLIELVATVAAVVEGEGRPMQQTYLDEGRAMASASGTPSQVVPVTISAEDEANLRRLAGMPASSSSPNVASSVVSGVLPDTGVFDRSRLGGVMLMGDTTRKPFRSRLLEGELIQFSPQP